MLKSPKPSPNAVLAFAAVSKDIHQEEQAAKLLSALLNEPDLTPGVTRSIHFALGKLHDRLGNYDRAFGHFDEGNKLKQAHYDSAAMEAEIKAIVGAFSPERYSALPSSTSKSEKPVFILGMPRSGTSLLEQILASHPRIHGAGELMFIPQLVDSIGKRSTPPLPYPHWISGIDQATITALSDSYLKSIAALSPDADRVTDKLPGNFMHLGLMAKMFPDARFIHCTRNPLDTCLSCYFQDFAIGHAYSYDISNLAHFYQQYSLLMTHWKSLLHTPILEVSYERLVESPATEIRQILDYCGMEWSDSCLEFHKTKRFIGTASHDQARHPLYKSSVGRWHHYESHIPELIARLTPLLTDPL